MSTAVKSPQAAKIRDVSDAAFDAVLSATREEGCWREHSQSRGVRVQCDKTSSLYRWRAFNTIDAPLSEVVKVASLVEERPSWDPMTSRGWTVEVVERETDKVSGLTSLCSCVCWEFKGLPGIVSTRSMCLALKVVEVEPGCWVTACRSMDHPDCPPASGAVRGHTECAGLVLKANGANGTDATYIASVDPKGWLPAPLVNLGAGKGAMCLEYLRQFVASEAAGVPS